ncbi:MAG TPA: hypothetical protein VKZ18_04275 [Polyangia bacterium]|nr:hypothetical protein [Polyangia bacterium]
MRGSWALALSLVVGLGCGSGSTTSSTGGSGGSASSGNSGGTSGGTIGTSTGGAAGHASSGSGGTVSSGSGGHATGGGSGGHASGGSGGLTGGGGHASGGSTGGGGHATGGATGSGGTIATDAGATSDDGGTFGPTGNPNASCSGGLPAGGQPADVSSATVVGNGTPASCTFAALNTAVGKAGAITFNCGPGAVTIPIAATMNLSISKNTVIDGGNKVTLDGRHAVQIFNYYSANYQALETRVTLQHLALVNGKTTPTQMIPPQPSMPACSQGWDDGQGGAINMRDGNLTVIDCLFDGNQAAPLGPDTGGGAIYILGSKHGALIVGSTFTNNSGANAGAVGALQSELDIYNSLFEDNTATGHDANNNDTTMKMCTAMNAGQYEIGSGGNGGAIYGDGNSFNITLCGDAVLNNAAGLNAFGGGLFFTSDDFKGVLTITDTTMTGNTGGSWTTVKSGSVMDAGSAVGVNAQSITITNSTLQHN